MILHFEFEYSSTKLQTLARFCA